MTNKSLSTSNKLFDHFSPLTVGFDSLFRELDNFTSLVPNSYPPHNVVKVSDTEFRLEFAVAGFNKDDINITIENGYLVIDCSSSTERLKEGETYHYQGISVRNFTKKFRLADNMEVKSADLDSGMLIITVVREIPEKDIPKKIEITQS